MAKITFRGYSINLRFIRATDVWQLELEKGEHLKTIAVGRDLTLIAIENIAFKEIDKLIDEEKKVIKSKTWPRSQSWPRLPSIEVPNQNQKPN